MTEQTPTLFCKIFVTGTDLNTIKSMTSALFGLQFERNSLTVEDFFIDVRRNPDEDATASASADFVRWPLLIELDTDEQDSVVTEKFVKATRDILVVMWDANLPAVAACDFEDQLPWKGGIQRQRDGI